MTEAIHVWAPRARVVEVELSHTGERLPMRAGPDGHFSLPASLVTGPYRLRLDGRDAVPDPRAGDVESTSGPCHWVDHSKFEWSDQKHAWPSLEGAVIYELHVGTFSPEGTFDGAVKKLPQLKALGVTHVELMPVATFSGTRNWGYDGASLFAPHRVYGGVDGMKRFVDAAHAQGLGVLLDVVYNHLGPIGNYLSQFGPYFLDDRHTPWGAAINFEGRDSLEVRRFFIDNALHWLSNYHLDGLRLDAVHAIHDESAIHVLEQLALEVAALGRPAMLIAESDLNDPRVIRSSDQHGFGMTAQWSDDLHHAIHCTLTGESHGYYVDFAPGPIVALARALDEGFVYQGQYAPSRRRNHGRPLGEVPLNRLLAYSQNHDQIGNRAYGERLHHLCGVPRAKMALALTLLGPGTPMLFQGEEWAATAPFQFFTDHQDAHVAKATTEGRLREFGAGTAPDPQSKATFEASVLDWEERSQGFHADMLAFATALIALRRSTPALRAATPGRTTVDPVRGTLTYQRGPFFFAMNLGPEAQGIALLPGTWTAALPLVDGATLSADALDLAANTFALLSSS